MRTPQELRSVILDLLEERKGNTHQMLKKCGYNPSLVNDLKKGQMPSADKLANIAKFLGVSSDYLLDAEPRENPDIDSDAVLLEELRKFTPEDMQILLEAVRMLAKMKNRN
jgi:transcriptional regulator with XRE-family HTH domain